jgi:hypothetical protein
MASIQIDARSFKPVSHRPERDAELLGGLGAVAVAVRQCSAQQVLLAGLELAVEVANRVYQEMSWLCWLMLLWRGLWLMDWQASMRANQVMQIQRRAAPLVARAADIIDLQRETVMPVVSVFGWPSLAVHAYTRCARDAV